MFGLDLPTLISRIIVLLTAFSVHEFAHAWVANSFGDDTPRLAGRLTLNPLAHLDVMGSLMLIVAGFGWAKPVPINPYALGRRSSAAVMWVSLAGPFSNLLMAILAAIPLRLGIVPFAFTTHGIFPTAYQFLFDFLTINLLLMLFNLIPLAPLDGEKIATYFFPPAWQRGLERIGPYGPAILLALIFLPPLLGFDLLGKIIGPPMAAITRLLIGGAL